MSSAEGSKRKSGYLVPIPVIERLRSPNRLAVPFCDISEAVMMVVMLED